MNRARQVRRRAIRMRLRSIFRTQEGGIFLLGLGFVVALVLWVMLAGRADPGRAAVMAAVVTAHLTGGRASGVAMAVGSARFGRLEIILLGSCIEGAVVCLFFSAFCLSCRKLIRVPWLDDAMRNVQESARSHRGRMVRWGIPGLIVFVWFPFLMTGPVVGAVIGFLLGLRPWVTVATVMTGTVSAIVSWTFLMKEIRELMGTIGNVMPLLFVLLLITVVVAFRYKRFRENQTLRRAAERAGSHTPIPSGADLTPAEQRRPR